MHDDELIDRLLKDVLAADVPELSPAFDAQVMRRVRPRGLTPGGRMAIAVYTVMAAAATVWLMQDVQIELILAALAIGVPIAAGASAYGRHLIAGD